MTVTCDGEFEELVGEDVAAVFVEAGYLATLRKDVIPYGRETSHSEILVTKLDRIQGHTPGTHTTNATIISAAELEAMDEPFLTEALDRLCAELMAKMERNVAPADGIRYPGVSVHAVTRWERAVVDDVVNNFEVNGYQVDVKADQYDDDYYDLIMVRGLDLKQSAH
ncbi:hypothetical protein BH10CYA1_BH10CYA1_18010 [soil metagenome]